MVLVIPLATPNTNVSLWAAGVCPEAVSIFLLGPGRLIFGTDSTGHRLIASLLQLYGSGTVLCKSTSSWASPQSKQARARTLDWEPSKWVHIPWHSHTHCTLTHCCCFCLLFSCTVVSSHSPSLSIQSHSVHTHTHPSLPFLSDGSFQWQHWYPVFREDWIKWMNEQIQSTID